MLLFWAQVNESKRDKFRLFLLGSQTGTHTFKSKGERDRNWFICCKLGTRLYVMYSDRKNYNCSFWKPCVPPKSLNFKLKPSFFSSNHDVECTTLPVYLFPYIFLSVFSPTHMHMKANRFSIELCHRNHGEVELVLGGNANICKRFGMNTSGASTITIHGLMLKTTQLAQRKRPWPGVIER